MPDEPTNLRDLRVSASQHDPLARLIDDHLARYPAMEPADVYKLLHQGMLGQST